MDLSITVLEFGLDGIRLHASIFTDSNITNATLINISMQLI